VRLEKFDSTLYFLDDREIDYLRSAIDREYSQDLALNVLGILLDILETRAQPSVRKEVIGILFDFLPALLSEGRFEAVAGLIAGIRDASRNATDLTEAQKDALDRLRSSVSSPAALSQLFHALEAGAVVPTAESMDILLRELRPSAIREVLTWGDRLTDPFTRHAVVQALDTFFTQWPHGLSRMLNANERDVVRAGLQLAERLKLPDFVEIVREVEEHADSDIRRQVAGTLAAIGTAPALRCLLGMVDDPVPDVRTVVYRTFKARPSRGAFGTFRRVIEGTDLEGLGQREKRSLFEAFGAVAGPEGVEVLEPLLRGRNPSGRRPSSHTRACAAMGLGMIGTPTARAALTDAAQDKDPLVRNAAAAALRGDR
jgi:HEAT repeat protein